MSNHLQDDTECIAAWKGITSRFNALIKDNPEPKKIEKDLIALRNEAAQKNALNYRQTDAVVGRVNNYLSGTYAGKINYQPNMYDQQRITGKPSNSK